jgi:hypothetical protein
MILGLSSYATGGKDTVARLIQELQPEKNWRIVKFSGPLKKIASILTGIPEHKFEDQKFKESFLGKEWHTEIGTPLDVVFDDVRFMKMMSVREFLQKLGTDAVRQGLHQNAWVNAAMSGYKKEFIGRDANGSPIEDYPNWIFTDCRFPNEAQAIKDSGGYVIRIDRSGVRPVNNHPSETALDRWDFDIKIANVSDLVALKQTVAVVMNLIK